MLPGLSTKWPQCSAWCLCFAAGAAGQSAGDGAAQEHGAAGGEQAASAQGGGPGPVSQTTPITIHHRMNLIQEPESYYQYPDLIGENQMFEFVLRVWV